MFRCENPFAALAHTCARVGPSGPLAGESTIVLLVEPADLEDVSGFAEAVERYAGESAIWVYESVGSPRLRTTTIAEMKREHPAARPAEAVRGPAPAVAAPQLRLSGEGALPPERGAEAEPDTPSPVPDVKFRSVISAPSVAQTGEVTSSLTPVPAVPVVQPKPSVQTLLTDEELAMLLAFEPEKRTS